MTTPLPQVLAAVPSLNDPQQPFVYEVHGETIVGRWDVDKAALLHPGEVGELNIEFSVTVTFDQAKGTFKAKDQEKSAGWSAGSGGASFGASTFSGKSFSKGGSITFGGGDSPKVTTWDTSRMKQPLFDFLASQGWKHKRGLFG